MVTFFLGQHSLYPYEQILVASTRESPCIRPDGSYRQIEVLSHRWHSLECYPVGYGVDSVIEAVRRFAEQLEGTLNNTPAPPSGSAWPQMVKVCAICQTITKSDLCGDITCPNDGTNPPTMMVKVMPVTE